MTIDRERGKDVVRLGTVERWIVASGAALVMLVLAYLGHLIMDTHDEQIRNGVKLEAIEKRVAAIETQVKQGP